MQRIEPRGETVEGIDISHYQDHVSLVDLAKKFPKIAFAFLKATEGASHVDKTFARHWGEAAAAGLLRGAYAFYHPSQNPIVQAKAFLKTVGHLGDLDLPLVMDWETTDNVPTATDVIGGLRFLSILEAESGKTPIIYGGPAFLANLGLNADFAHYPLWVANYGAKAPLIPKPWTDWHFWQYTGVEVDHNLFNGSLDDLKAFAKRAADHVSAVQALA